MRREEGSTQQGFAKTTARMCTHTFKPMLILTCLARVSPYLAMPSCDHAFFCACVCFPQQTYQKSGIYTSSTNNTCKYDLLPINSHMSFVLGCNCTKSECHSTSISHRNVQDMYNPALVRKFRTCTTQL